MQSYSGIILIVVMVAVMYFLMIRPQQKQRSQHQNMVSALKKGDKVITIGRLHGVIDSVDNTNKTVVLDVEGIYLTFDLAAVASVVPADAPAPAAPVVSETAETEEPADSSEEPASSAEAVEETPAESARDATSEEAK